MEGDAGADQLNPTEADGSTNDAVTETRADPAPDTSAALSGAAPSGRQSRLGRGWFIGISAALVVLAAGIATGGYFALRAHDQSLALARADQAALAAAKDCVSATHAPDIAAMSASQRKIIECSTGDFEVQATLYSGVLVDAYQAADVKVQVSDMRAAVERHNDDGSINVLVAVRVRVSNAEIQDQEQGYRLRVRMAPTDGQYKIARLDQVSS
jgi:Mce-associated membrane protein